LAREEQVRDVGAGAAAHVKQVRGPERTAAKEIILQAEIQIPVGAIGEDFDVEEVRIKFEEFVEALTKMIKTIDDKDMCGSASTQIYRTTTAWAERIDYCLGRVGDGSHIHAVEEYGRNMNEYWLNTEVFVATIEEETDLEEEVDE
jgi:hypothetical protein